MRRTLTILIALALAVAPALAETLDPTTTSGDVKITADIAETYTVSIPEDLNITFGALSSALGDVKLAAARFQTNYGVKVTAARANKLTHANGTNEIAYELKNGSTAFTEAYLEAVGDTISLTIDIAQTAWDAAIYGKYTDTITFTVAYGALP